MDKETGKSRVLTSSEFKRVVKMQQTISMQLEIFVVCISVISLDFVQKRLHHYVSVVLLIHLEI